jgi:Rieske Fe-S protein
VTEPLVSRRSLLRGGLVTVVAGVVGYVVADHSSAARTSNGATAANAYGPNPSGRGHLLSAIGAVPAGGGIVLAGNKIVLTRGPAGDIHGFSAICTHQGCLVGSVQHGQIICPCHGSRFNAETGAVINGPANLPLPSIPVTIHGGGVYSA